MREAKIVSDGSICGRREQSGEDSRRTVVSDSYASCAKTQGLPKPQCTKTTGSSSVIAAHQIPCHQKPTHWPGQARLPSAGQSGVREGRRRSVSNAL